MDLNLRNAVIANVTGNNQDQLEHTIVDAIQSGEEKCFRIGVLFEVLWQHASDSEKMKCSKHLKAD